jgi:diketogulonate reductase-like aldo/keto reductase
MLTRPIHAIGEAIPVIGLGTWSTFDAHDDAGRRGALKAVLAAFAERGRLVDCSPMYGSAERVLGELARGLKLFIATKVWTTGKAAGVKQMEASERLLGKIDLMQVHNLVDADTHLGTLREWKAQGRIRCVGITHYTASAHAAVERTMRAHPIDALQINYALFDRQAEERLLPLARDLGVSVIVNRPLGEGAVLRRLAKQPLPDFAAELGCRTWAQLALKFVVSHPAVTCAIPATGDLRHLQDDLAAGDAPMPDAALRERIAAAAGS